MAYFFPEGSKLFFSDYTAFASSINVTSITNANPAVATTATNTYAVNDELLLEGSWDEITDSIFRASAVTSTSVTFAGLNTTSTALFPTGGSAGTLKKISSWTEIPQVLGIQTQGGDARMSTISPLGRRNDISVPTGFNAMTMQVTMGYDPSLAAYQTMLGLSRTLTKIGFKMVTPAPTATTGLGYGFGYISVPEAPQLQRGQANQVVATVTILNKFTSY